jgi:succinoglycan biosynthesis transport protein ExoP
MQPSEYLSALRKHWIVIVLLGVLGAVAGYGYSTTLPERYRATASVYVSLQQGESVSELVQGTTYAQNLVQSYAQLATMPFVLDPVIDRLGLDTTARALGRSITATSPLDTPILEVSAVSGSPAGAAELANAVSTELSAAVQQLATDAGPGGAAIDLTTVAEATPPAFAFSPNTKLNTATGAALGLALGVLFALAHSLLDTRVRGLEDVRRVTGTAVLSTVRYLRQAGRGAFLAVRDEPFGEHAEAYRRLRTNLKFLHMTGGSRAIVVTSAVPGEGKSTTAANLAIAMSEGAGRVLLVDADLRRPSIARYMGVEGGVGLTTVLIGEADAEDVIQTWGAGLDILPAGALPPNPSELLDSEAMADLLVLLRSRYDVVLLDSAPLLPVTDGAVLSRMTDGALVVVGCRTTRRHQVADALSALDAVGARVLGLVLNQVSGHAAGTAYVYGSTPRSTARAWSRRREAPAIDGARRPVHRRTAAPAGPALGDGTAGVADATPQVRAADRSSTARS